MSRKKTIQDDALTARVAELEAELGVANDRLAGLWAQLTKAKVQYEPVSFLEVDHDDPMQVKDGVALYKDWDSSEWFSLFPDGIMVMQRAQPASNAAGVERWQPVKNNRIEVSTGGDSMNTQRLKCIDIMPDGSLRAWTASLSMAGEKMYGYSIKFPIDVAICQRLTASPQPPAVVDDWAKTVDYLVSLAPEPEPTYDTPEPPEDYDEEDSPHYDTPGGW